MDSMMGARTSWFRLMLLCVCEWFGGKSLALFNSINPAERGQHHVEFHSYLPLQIAKCIDQQGSRIRQTESRRGIKKPAVLFMSIRPLTEIENTTPRCHASFVNSINVDPKCSNNKNRALVKWGKFTPAADVHRFWWVIPGPIAHTTGHPSHMQLV